MNIEFLTLCEAADLEGDTISVTHASNRLFSKSPASIIARCCVVFRIRFELNEEGEHNASISILDADGVSLTPPNSYPIVVKISGRFITNTLIGKIGIKGIVFPNYGEYSLNLLVDGVVLGSQPIYCSELLE